jgi:hypothetical protein
LDAPGWDIPSSRANSVTGRSPARSSTRISRRCGSAIALKTSDVVAARAMGAIIFRYRHTSSPGGIIRVAGVLDVRWAAWFGGLQISGEGEETVICGLVADQSALHGLLTKVRDLGLCLISVRRLDTGQAETRHHDQT